MDDVEVREDIQASEFEAMIEQLRQLRLQGVPGIIQIINFNQIIVGRPREEEEMEDNSDESRSGGTFTDWESYDDSEGWSSDSDTTQPLYLLSLLFF